MSAIETAYRVLQWARSGLGPLPRGDLRDTEELENPPPAVWAAAQHLVALWAARLRWGTPPLGDGRPLGVGMIVMAAALGAADSKQVKLARALLSCLPPAPALAERLGRHSLLEPALTCLPEILVEECRSQSSLTSLLGRPEKGQESQAFALALRILKDKRGRSSLQFTLAEPTTDQFVRRWRTDLLDRLRLGDSAEQAFVLDVYETIMIYHRLSSMDQIRSARTVMTDRLAARDENLLQNALSIAAWWGPLWKIHRQDVDALRRRPYLHYDFLEGLKLYQMHRRLAGGVA